MTVDDGREGGTSPPFPPVGADIDEVMARIRRFVAPVARNAAAIGNDRAVLRAGEAVVAAFGDLGAGTGLTKVELATAVEHLLGGPAFEARLDHMVRTGMLIPVRDKQYQVRYLLSPDVPTSMLLWDRLAEDGGISELARLLDRTADGLRSGTLGVDEVRRRMNTIRHNFAINAGYLSHLVRTAPRAKLIRHRRDHRRAEELLDQAKQLVELLVERYPQLGAVGDHMVAEAIRYSGAVGAFIERLFREAAAHRDFSMLDPEQYFAAVRSDRDALAVPFARVVFDRPAPWLDPATLGQALDQLRPRRDRRRPPEPVARSDQDDPMARVTERAKERRRRREDAIEAHLDGSDERDLTSHLKAGPWSSTARVVAEVLAAHADPALPFQAEISEAVNVAPDGPVSWISAITVSRSGRRSPSTPRRREERS